jgi:drug/metabolite transporter (DMT)-like permease
VIKISKRHTAYLWLLVNTITWGLAFVMVKPALSEITPFRFLFYRFALASLISLPILAYYLRKKINWKKLLRTVISLELVGTTVALALLYSGLNRTTATEANLLVITLPLFVTIGGVVILKEKQEKHEILGLAVALIGTVWLSLQTNGFTGEYRVASLIGNGLILSHNLLNLGYFPLAKKLYRPYPKFLVTTLSFYVGLVSFGLLAWIETQTDFLGFMAQVSQDLTYSSVWIAAGYTAIFGSIIGLTAYIKGQDTLEASEASWFWYLQAAVALPAGMLLLGDHVTINQLLALGVILLGIILAEKRSRPTSRSHS